MRLQHAAIYYALLLFPRTSLFRMLRSNCLEATNMGIALIYIDT